jgi:hypothetical protein
MWVTKKGSREMKRKFLAVIATQSTGMSTPKSL